MAQAEEGKADVVMIYAVAPRRPETVEEELGLNPVIQKPLANLPLLKHRSLSAWHSLYACASEESRVTRGRIQAHLL